MFLSPRTLSVLRLSLSISEDSAPYNQFSLPFTSNDRVRVSICTYFKSYIKAPKEIPLYAGDGSLLGFLRAMKMALNSSSLDIVHVHTPQLGLLLILMIPFIGRLLDKSVLTVHNSYPSYKPRNKLLYLLIFTFYRKVIFCSHASFDSFPTIYKALAGNRSRVIPNGVDINRVDKITNNCSKAIQSNNFKLVVVGRLVPIKNPLMALQSFYRSSNNNCTLTFIGEGLLRDDLMLGIEKLNLNSRVNITGLIPREDVFVQLLDADLFISTSKGEDLPVAVLEAMACRCPVLLSDIPSHREIADSADFIQLISPDDLAGFTREINRYRHMEKVDRTRIGEKCRELVEERFSLDQMLAAYEEIYLEVARLIN